MNFHPGEMVLFNHSTFSWVVGTVKTVGEKTIACECGDQKRGIVGGVVSNLTKKDVTPVMSSVVNEDVDDLLELTVLHEGMLLRTLFLRYDRNVIYTNLGAIVVAINPFTYDIPWYQDGEMTKYVNHEGPINMKTGSGTLLPHTWSTAHNTYCELIEEGAAQFILVSGESGAGKTEAAKIVVKYLTAISLKHTNSEKDREICPLVGERMQKTSPILEAFGNARTVRNNNSSRFGKFMKLQFTESRALVGAFTTRYLLEKSRILTAAKGERLYHSFYLLNRGYLVSKLQLVEKDFVSLRRGGILSNEDFDTEADFNEVCGAMKIIGMNEQQITSSWSVAAAILFLQNTAVEGDDRGRFNEFTLASLQKAADLLGVSVKALEKELSVTRKYVKSEVIEVPNSAQKLLDARDALCKALYDSLFGWLVVKCNEMCDSGDCWGWIGLLDIFGFENFTLNSFEQLCINLANETLQNHYNAYIFERDMEECRAEGINTESITFFDNTECVNLILHKRNGIFALLDDQQSFATATDEKLRDIVCEVHKTNKFFSAARIQRTPQITIQHFAGPVTYELAGWLEKNRDPLTEDVKTFLCGSTDDVVNQLFEKTLGERAPGKSVTISALFRQQLDELMGIINQSNPHWVRCVKPNPQKVPHIFDGNLVATQLSSSGVLQTVMIFKSGYPVRYLYEKFATRYEILLSASERERRRKCDPAKVLAESKKAAQQQISTANVDLSHYQLGKTKVFMKSHGLDTMEKARRDRYLKFVMCIQKVSRGHRARIALAKKRFRKAALEILMWRRRQNIRRRCKFNCSARIVQMAFRRYKVRTATRRKFLKSSTLQWLQERQSLTQPTLDEFIASWSVLLIALESAGRESLEQMQDHTWGTVRSRVLYDFVAEEEEMKRKHLQASILSALWFFGNDALEEAQMMLIREERKCRRDVEYQFFRAFSKGDFLVHFQLQLCCQEDAARRRVVREYTRQMNDVIVSGFFKIAFDHLEYSRGPSTEKRGRYLIFEEERERRSLLKQFERKFQQRVRLLMEENSEARERAQICDWQEVAARRELEQAFHRKRVGLHVEESSRLLESEALFCCEEVWAEEHIRWQLILQFFTESYFDVLLHTTEADEARLRKSICSTEKIQFYLLMTSQLMPSDFAALVALQDEEKLWRGRMHQFEASVRYNIVANREDEVELVAAEQWYRRILFMLWLHQMKEIKLRIALMMNEEQLWRTDVLIPTHQILTVAEKRQKQRVIECAETELVASLRENESKERSELDTFDERYRSRSQQRLVAMLEELDHSRQYREKKDAIASDLYDALWGHETFSPKAQPSNRANSNSAPPWLQETRAVTIGEIAKEVMRRSEELPSSARLPSLPRGLSLPS